MELGAGFKLGGSAHSRRQLVRSASRQVPVANSSRNRGNTRRGGPKQGGAELSRIGAGLGRRGAGHPAPRAGASGLLRWLSPARNCGFPGSSPRWRPRPRTAPRAGLKRRSAASLSTRTARKRRSLPGREVGDRKWRPEVLSCPQLAATGSGLCPKRPAAGQRRLSPSGLGLGIHLLPPSPPPAGDLGAPNPSLLRPRAGRGWSRANAES